ncbi:hypothetical protein BDV96DRAFT_644141 [Lophiotrema nucula]|uniref:Cupin type-2 domain-containing protein n=1 Tax=Lophiotrema nucula TaxID=690887 RepID=A0A6A5ZHE1_9PLEO|nr:hypothetical protein BDV96DRAFT_644141 [Lophiotrema nucula]
MAERQPSATSLPPVKRYILTHTPTGKSTIHSSPPQQYVRHDAGGFARSYATTSTPVDFTNEADINSYLSTDGPASVLGTSIVVPTASGAACLVVELKPGGETQMHRTVSLDFSIAIVGGISMELDSGEVIKLNPGDHIIQRGTLHKWINNSTTEPARFIAVTVPCAPFEIPGTGENLEETWL